MIFPEEIVMGQQSSSSISTAISQYHEYIVLGKATKAPNGAAISVEPRFDRIEQIVQKWVGFKIRQWRQTYGCDATRPGYILGDASKNI